MQIETSPETLSDEQKWSALMSRAQRGDEVAYRQLLTEIARAIEGFLRRKIGHRHFMEDCVQETLVSIHQARHTWDPSRPFRPWLFAIVRNKAIDELRRQRRERVVFDSTDADVELAPAGSSGERAERLETLGTILEKLPAQLRDVLVLTKLRGLSTAEAATALNISGAALRVRSHRAISRLKKLLEEETLD